MTIKEIKDRAIPVISKPESPTIPNSHFFHKLKILWYSVAPHISTGYGVVTKNVVYRILGKGYDVVIAAYYGIEAGGYVKQGDAVIVPIEKNALSDPFGYKSVKTHFAKFKRDILIFHTDFWISEKLTELVPEAYCYSPIDSEKYPEKFIKILKSYEGLLIPSKHGVAEVKKYGVNAEYMPHGVDTSVFKPLNKIECREHFKLKKDDFIVGIVAANSDKEPRKGWDAMFLGARMFLDKFPEAEKNFRIFAHTKANDRAGYNLFGTAKTCNIDKNLTFQDQYLSIIGMPDVLLARLYNCFDVILMLSSREGFCLPVAEAGACGIPAIVTNFSALPERVNYGKCGWLVPHKGLKVSGFNALTAIPNSEGCAKALEEAYFDQHKRENFGKKAILWNQSFDWNVVVDKYWVPWLKKIEDEYGLGTKKSLEDRKVLEV